MSALQDKNELNKPRGSPGLNSSGLGEGCGCGLIFAVSIALVICSIIAGCIGLYRNFFEGPGSDTPRPAPTYTVSEPQIAHFRFTMSKQSIYKLTSSGQISLTHNPGPTTMQLTAAGVKLGPSLKFIALPDNSDQGNDTCYYDSYFQRSASSFTASIYPSIISRGGRFRFCTRIIEKGVATDYTFVILSNGAAYASMVNGHLVGRLQLQGPVRADVYVCKPQN